MPPGRRACLSRRLLRSFSIDDLRRVADYYGLPRARTHEQMVVTAMKHVGPGLANLVSHAGPLTLGDWNLVATKLGGQPRRSFEDLQAELAFRLDPVAQEFDLEESVSDVRDDAQAVRRLAKLLGIDMASLVARLQETHGRTLLGNLVSQFRAELSSTLTDDDENQSSDEDEDEDEDEDRIT